METTANNPNGTAPENDNRTIVRTQQKNALRFIEYEQPLENGHFMSITDRFHNVLGRVHRQISPEGKLEYVAYDHEGKAMFKAEELALIKRQFLNEKERLFKEAHERRKSLKKDKKWKDVSREPMSFSPIRFGKKTKKAEKTQEQKPQPVPAEKAREEQRQVAENTREYEKEMQQRIEREDRLRELEELRGDKIQNRDQEIER